MVAESMPSQPMELPQNLKIQFDQHLELGLERFQHDAKCKNTWSKAMQMS